MDDVFVNVMKDCPMPLQISLYELHGALMEMNSRYFLVEKPRGPCA